MQLANDGLRDLLGFGRLDLTFHGAIVYRARFRRHLALSPRDVLGVDDHIRLRGEFAR